MSLVSCLLSVGSILETISLIPAPAANRSGPISTAQQSGAEPGHSVRGQRSRPQRALSRVAALGSIGSRASGGHGYSRSRNSTRSGSIARLIQSPTHCHPHLVSPCFPICGRSPFSLPLPFSLLLAPVTSHNPVPPARQRMRCAVHADTQSLAAGKADRSPPACLSPRPLGS